MTILASVAFTLCVLDLAALAYACSRPPIAEPAPTPLPRPEPLRQYTGGHRTTEDVKTVRLPKLPTVLTGVPR